MNYVPVSMPALISVGISTWITQAAVYMPSRNYAVTINFLPSVCSATLIPVTPPRRQPHNWWNMRVNMCLKFFNADPEEYLAIFTSNASGALKLVGESYPFSKGRYLLTFDNHNSVNGIREFAHFRGAEVTYIPITLPDMRVDEFTTQPGVGAAFERRRSHNLFAYPAQSNFSSVQHPLDWIEKAHQHGWDVLLDAAAFVPTNKLDLSAVKPDFVPISFYKMFGYPTGLGALIARKEALAKLQRPWFAGGTITVASVQGDKYYLADGASAFEDGTIDYLNIPAVEIGLKHIESIGYDVIHERVRSLTGWLLDNLTSMKHSNGTPLVRIYGPTTMEERGGAVTVNFYDPGRQGAGSSLY